MDIPPRISRNLLAIAIDQSHDGITISDAQETGWPLIYVNAGFERLTGYKADELLGKSLKLLQGTDTEQPEIATLREAMQQRKNCLITLRNYRRDGSMFWNELSLSPIRDEHGVLTHYIGIQNDVTARIQLDQHLHQSNRDLRTQLHKLAHTNPPVGIGNHFEEQLAAALQSAQRTHSLLSVVMINLDQFGQFNERYGHAAGDICLRMVGERIVRSFARGTDWVAHRENDRFAVVSMGDSPEGMQQHLRKLRDQVRALNIPHHDSPEGVVTICIGCVSLIPQRDTTASDLLEQASAALHDTREHDCQNIVS